MVVATRHYKKWNILRHTQLHTSDLPGNNWISDGWLLVERGGGELNIQSIPSELELVQEKDLGEGGGAGAGPLSLATQQTDQGGSNTMLWKRVRHCVVFGGKIIKPKKEKDWDETKHLRNLQRNVMCQLLKGLVSIHFVIFLKILSFHCWLFNQCCISYLPTETFV